MNNIEIFKKDNNFICKTPIHKRLRKSKFANMIKKMSDEQIKGLIYCLIFDKDLKNAIDCFSHSISHEVQLFALQREYEKRFNK